MKDIMCHECKKPTKIVHDQKSGDVICSECGLVLEDHVVDERPEWRTFEGEDLPTQIRAESTPTNFVFNKELFATIAPPPKGESLDRKLDVRHVHEKLGKIEESSKWRDGFEIISHMVEKLQLVKTIEDYAMEIYKEIKTSKRIQERTNILLAASCLYLSCKREKKSRTLKEITDCANANIQACEISRMCKKIHEKLEELGHIRNQGEHNTTMCVRRFCSKLQLPSTEVKAILETTENLKEHDIRRKPLTILAATIFMVTQISSEKRSLKEISSATSVGVLTITSTYKEMCLIKNKIIPRWFLDGVETSC